MTRGLLALLLLALAAGCQLTKEDFQPVHLRKGGAPEALVRMIRLPSWFTARKKTRSPILPNPHVQFV